MKKYLDSLEIFLEEEIRSRNASCSEDVTAVANQRSSVTDSFFLLDSSRPDGTSSSICETAQDEIRNALHIQDSRSSGKELKSSEMSVASQRSQTCT